MDPSTMHEVWLNLATNSPFLAFVIYNWHVQSKRNEEYRQEMKKDRDRYDQKREEGIEAIRDRYSKVIDDLKTERKKGVEERLLSVERGIKKIFSMVDKLKEEINEVKIKDHAR